MTRYSHPCSRAGLKEPAIDRRVVASQRFTCTMLDDPPAFHDHDVIGSIEGFQAVGYKYGRAVCEEPVRRALDLRLCGRVEARGRFVQDH